PLAHHSAMPANQKPLRPESCTSHNVPASAFHLWLPESHRSHKESSHPPADFPSTPPYPPDIPVVSIPILYSLAPSHRSPSLRESSRGAKTPPPPIAPSRESPRTPKC